MVRFDYACKKCEKTFTVWSDEARRCAYCGSVRVFKVFLTPPAASTGNAARIEKLAEQQLNAAGLSNYTNVGGTIRRERMTDPKELEAIAAAKANNIEIPKTGPAKAGIEANVQRLREQYRALGADGLLKASGATGGVRGKDGKLKSIATTTPQGPGQLVQNIVHRGRQVDPLAAKGEKLYHRNAKDEPAMLKSLLRR